MMRELSLIAKERKALGISQKKLARMAGVSQSLISKIERGQLVPSYEVAVKIFKALEMARKERGCTKASEIMTSPIISVSPDDTVAKAISLMEERGISQLPVMMGGRVIGSVTEEGLLRKLSSLSSEARISEVIEGAFPIFPPDASISMLRDMLLLYPAVLIQDKGKIVGIITKSDLLKKLGEEC